jgi:ankyrin repeat protein
MDWTPLMHLAENAHWPENVHLAHTLLEYGAEVDAVDKCGNSALYYAVTIGAASPQRNKFVQELVDRSANVDAVRSKVTKRTVNKFVALKQQAGSRGGTLSAMRPRPLQRL